MKYNCLNSRIFVGRVSDTQMVYFSVLNNKFMIYHDTLEGGEEGKYTKSGFMFTMLTFGGAILIRYLSRFSNLEYWWLRILILLGLAIAIILVAKDMLTDMSYSRYNSDRYWTDISLNRQEISEYLSKFESTNKKITIMLLVLLFSAVFLGIVYIIIGESLILPFYAGSIMFGTFTLTSYSYKLYRLAKKQMIQLIESGV